MMMHFKYTIAIKLIFFLLLMAAYMVLLIPCDNYCFWLCLAVLTSNANLIVQFACRNPSYWGKLCFLSTPDGENCGLVKNLAVAALVSLKVTEPILDKLISCGMEKLDEISLSSVSNMDKVFLNGDWVGVCADSSSFVARLRCMRRDTLIHPQVCLFLPVY